MQEEKYEVDYSDLFSLAILNIIQEGYFLKRDTHSRSLIVRDVLRKYPILNENKVQEHLKGLREHKEEWDSYDYEDAAWFTGTFRMITPRSRDSWTVKIRGNHNPRAWIEEMKERYSGRALENCPMKVIEATLEERLQGNAKELKDKWLREKCAKNVVESAYQNYLKDAKDILNKTPAQLKITWDTCYREDGLIKEDRFTKVEILARFHKKAFQLEQTFNEQCKKALPGNQGRH